MTHTFESVWAQALQNHDRHSYTGSDEDDIRFLTLGVDGEAGEIIEAIIIAARVAKATGKIANSVKKRWRDSSDESDAIRKEIADTVAYAMMLAHKMGMGPQDLLDMIAAKQEHFLAKMALKPVIDVEEWRPIHLLNPVDKMIVLGWGQYRELDGFSQAYIRWYASMKEWRVNGNPFYPTMWMPLPPNPTENQIQESFE